MQLPIYDLQGDGHHQKLPSLLSNKGTSPVGTFRQPLACRAVTDESLLPEATRSDGWSQQPQETNPHYPVICMGIKCTHMSPYMRRQRASWPQSRRKPCDGSREKQSQRGHVTLPALRAREGDTVDTPQEHLESMRPCQHLDFAR